MFSVYRTVSSSRKCSLCSSYALCPIRAEPSTFSRAHRSMASQWDASGAGGQCQGVTFGRHWLGPHNLQSSELCHQRSRLLGFLNVSPKPACHYRSRVPAHTPACASALYLKHPKHVFGVIILVVLRNLVDALKSPVFCTTGVQLQPGTYTVQPASGNGHIYLTCSARSSAFEISLAGSTLLFAVSQQPG